MWFGVLDEAKSTSTIEQLAGFEHQTDWGMRIISNHHPLYSGGGYHFGSVWPLFTGWASVAEYRTHQTFPGYANLRANALLALDGSSGHVTEVLSGDYYQSLSTSSPHQIWSAAMVVSPLLRGMMGLETDAAAQTIKLAPALPANWNSFGLKNVQAGKARADFSLSRTPEEMALEIQRAGSGECTLLFEPALSLRAEVTSVELNERPVPFRVEANASDQHLKVRAGLLAGKNILRVRLRHDFASSYDAKLPELAEPTQGLHILSETWSADRSSLSLRAQGAPGRVYELSVFNSPELSSVQGGTLRRSGDAGKISIAFAGDRSEEFSEKTVVLRFLGKAK
jgi:hypothetical protein